MKRSVFTTILVLVGVVFPALPPGSAAGAGVHGGGGHFGGGHVGGFHGGRLPTISPHFNFSSATRSHSVFGGSEARGFGERNFARSGGRLPVIRQTVQRHSDSSIRARLASHNSGSQLPSLSRGASTVRSATIDRHRGTSDSVANLHRDTGGEGADRSPEWHQGVNDQRDYWNRWGNENDRRIQQFRTDREQRWSRIDHFWSGRTVAQTYDSRDWRDYRDQVAAFRDDRRVEILDGVRYYHADLFDDRWWAGCGWWPGVLPGSFIDGFWDPWWWWGACSWDRLTAFLDWGWSQPVTYDYDVNLVDEGDIMYFDQQPEASATQYEQQAIELGNPQPAPPPPAPDQGWTPLGVWALCQEEKGDADTFVQLSVNKSGQISGAYTDVLTGEKGPISGQIDKATQRAVFHLGENPDSVIETGADNLTQSVTSCRVYLGKEKPQTRLLVRLPAPKMPSAPTPVPAKSNPVPTDNGGTRSSTAETTQLTN